MFNSTSNAQYVGETLEQKWSTPHLVTATSLSSVIDPLLITGIGMENTKRGGIPMASDNDEFNFTLIGPDWKTPRLDEIAHPEWGGLNKLELEKLANYNGEVMRGLLHSKEWKAEMERLQVRFDGG